MKSLNKTKFVSFFLVIALSFISIFSQKIYAYSNPAPVPLLTAGNFAALAKTLVSSPTGPTVLNDGDLGVASPGTCTNFGGVCTGPINGTINGGAIQHQNAVALQGQTDATAAVTNIGSRAADQTLVAQLGGQTVTQGVYEVPAATTNLTGNLTLDGDANSIFIFHMTSSLITDPGSKVILTGGVQPCNVFWKVDSSATFNGNTEFVGTVLASASVTFPGGGATLNGRAIAQTGGVTFNNTTVNSSSCENNPTITPSPTNSPNSTPTPVPTGQPTQTPSGQPSPTQIPTNTLTPTYIPLPTRRVTPTLPPYPVCTVPVTPTPTLKPATPSPTHMPTNTPTPTQVVLPTRRVTPTLPPYPVCTVPLTPTPTLKPATPSPTHKPTNTPTPTQAPLPTRRPTATPCTFNSCSYVLPICRGR